VDISQFEDLKVAVADRCGVELDVTVHSSIDSTNDWSLRQCSTGKILPFACFAENQTHGKGRRGKQWLMSPNANIAMSLSWSFALPYQSLQLLPLSVAMAIVKTLETINIKQVQIKWPNDVYVNGKKIAGILIETSPVRAGSKLVQGAAQFAGPRIEGGLAVVIGVGLNYDMRPMSQAHEELPVLTDVYSHINTSSADKRAHDTGRSAVATELLSQVVAVCRNYQKNTRCYLDEFRETYDYCLHKNVEIVRDNGEIVTGLAQGVNEDAELIVNIEGKQEIFNSAEVSVKAGENNSLEMPSV